jgi:serine/threonine-protein kinase
MTFTAGIRIGPYEITSPLGEGGMGIVYRARDTKLERDVALKVLPDHFADDPDRLSRFQREAQVLASLNHPNIAQIYGLEDSGNTRCIVMELVDGETLQERLARGPMTLDDALPIARQIAEALEAAHERGIMHRDLKPANMKLTADGKVKVLDFGLAKIYEAANVPHNVSNSPTLTAAQTLGGVILGTAAYMSPEQARGRAVEKRTDIWAFGCVLYEMLTAQPAFRGEDTTEILASVVKAEPEWQRLPADLPANIRTLLFRCLQKDTKKRIRDAGDIVIELEQSPTSPVSDLASSTSIGPVSFRRSVLFSLIGVLISAAVTGVAVWRLKPVPAAPVGRFSIVLPHGQRLAGLDMTAMTFSPDGKRLAYVATSGGPRQLYVRETDSLDARPLTGTENAVSPFFSPDGEWIGFFTGDSLKKIAMSGGPPVRLARVEFFGRGGTWGTDGNIAFATGTDSGLSLVSDSGGGSQTLTTLDRQKAEASHRFPHYLPGGSLLFTVGTGGSWDDARIEVLKPGTGEKKVVIEGGSDGRYLPSGHLVFLRGGNLMAVPFDLRRLEVTGSPKALVEGILPSTNNTGAAQAAFADAGSVAYVSGGGKVSDRTLVWVDRNGMEQPLRLPARAYRHPRLSPDENRLLVDIDEGNKSDLWVCDLLRGTLIRLSFDDVSGYPEWTPDGKNLAYQARPTGVWNIFWKATDGTGKEERLTTSPNLQWADSWSPDGNTLAFTEVDPVTHWDIWTLSIKDRRKSQFLRTPFNETYLVFSPDGRWVAYQSDESGRDEIYVQPFPGPGTKELISIDGGTDPLWSRDGRQLLYRNGDKMVSVAITVVPTFHPSKPEVVFESPYWAYEGYSSYTVTADGRRFVMIKENEQVAKANVINVVLNWTSELKQRIPVK